MSAVMRFCDVLDAAEELTLDEQAELVEVMQRRLAEQRRERFMEELRQSQAEYARGEAKRVTSIDDLMKELETP